MEVLSSTDERRLLFDEQRLLSEERRLVMEREERQKDRELKREEMAMQERARKEASELDLRDSPLRQRRLYMYSELKK